MFKLIPPGTDIQLPFYLFERCAQAITNKDAWTGYLSLGCFFPSLSVFFFGHVCFRFHKIHVCYLFFIFACIFLCTDHTSFLL